MEDIKTVAQQIARGMAADTRWQSFANHEEWEQYHAEFASRLLAELQKDVEPCAVFGDHYITPEGTTEAFVWTNREIAPGTKLYTHPQPKAATVPGRFAEIVRGVLRTGESYTLSVDEAAAAMAEKGG